MASLLINSIPDEALHGLEALARKDHVSVEQEACEAVLNYVRQRGECASVVDRAELLRKAQELHADMDAAGVCIPIETIISDIKEARR